MVVFFMYFYGNGCKDLVTECCDVMNEIRDNETCQVITENDVAVGKMWFCENFAIMRKKKTKTIVRKIQHLWRW